MIPVVLAIGALDPSGLDGLLADMRTCAALGVHGAVAATLIRVNRAAAAERIPTEVVTRQVRSVLDAGTVAAIKLGLLDSDEMTRAVAEVLDGCSAPIVADPCMAGREGVPLTGSDAIDAWRATILPIATVVTPNMAEAALLTGTGRATTLGDMLRQGQALVGFGCRHAVVSGGHGRSAASTDILVSRGRPPMEMRAERMERGDLRGLSATLASAVAAHIAHGFEPFDAIHRAKLFVSAAIDAADGYEPSPGPRPVHQMHRMWRRAEVDAGA